MSTCPQNYPSVLFPWSFHLTTPEMLLSYILPGPQSPTLSPSSHSVTGLYFNFTEKIKTLPKVLPTFPSIKSNGTQTLCPPSCYSRWTDQESISANHLACARGPIPSSPTKDFAPTINCGLSWSILPRPPHRFLFPVIPPIQGEKKILIPTFYCSCVFILLC